MAVEEILRLEKARFSFYIWSSTGSVHLRYMKRYVKLTKKARKEAFRQADTDGIIARQVIETLEYFDEEGSGSVRVDSLSAILKRLLIPVDKEKLAYLRDKFDPDGSGYLNLTDLLEWYGSEDADDFVEPETGGQLLRLGWLK
eukprot:gene47210-61143_t